MHSFPPPPVLSGAAPAADRAAIDAALGDLHERRFADPGATLAAARELAARSRLAGHAGGLGAALRLCGVAYSRLSNLDEAEESLRQAEQVLHGRGDDVELHRTRVAMGTVQARRGRHGAAIRAFQAGLATFRDHGDRIAEADTLIVLGWVYKELASYSEALEALLRARQIAEDAGDRRVLLRALNNLACVYGELEDLELTEQTYQQALALARAEGETSDEAAVLGNLGVNARHLGRHDPAMEYVRAALAMCRPLGLRKAESFLLLEAGEIHLARSDVAQAIECVSDALQLARASGERINEAMAAIKLGELRVAAGDPEGAVELLSRGLHDAECLELTASVRDAHLALAAAHEARGDVVAALAHHRAVHQAQARLHASEAKVRLQQRRAMQSLDEARRNAEMRLLESELETLKAQLDPHFLFNALNALATLMHRDVAAADAMLLTLAKLLRLVLRDSHRHVVPLAHEISFVSLYLQLEQIRFGAPVNLTVKMERALGAALVPRFILHPLIQDAVDHGHARRRPAGIVLTAVRAPAGMLEVSIVDDGAGPPHEAAARATGKGLARLRERLDLLHPGRISIEVLRIASGGTRVDLRLPFIIPPDAGAPS